MFLFLKPCVTIDQMTSNPVMKERQVFIMKKYFRILTGAAAVAAGVGAVIYLIKDKMERDELAEDFDDEFDDDFEELAGDITPEQWPAFAPADLPSGTIYNIIYGEKRVGSTQKIFMLRGISNGQEMEMTFKKSGSQWKLTKLVE